MAPLGFARFRVGFGWGLAFWVWLALASGGGWGKVGLALGVGWVWLQGLEDQMQGKANKQATQSQQKPKEVK